MKDEDVEEWINNIDKEIKALTRIIIEKEMMIVDLDKKRRALLELKESRKKFKQ